MSCAVGQCFFGAPVGQRLIDIGDLEPTQITAVEQLITAYRATALTANPPPTLDVPAAPRPATGTQVPPVRTQARDLVVDYDEGPGCWVPRPGIVYFMRHVPSGYVKIGRTIDLRKRQREIPSSRTAWPPGVERGPVNVIAAQFVDDAPRVEGDLHERFRDLRVAGTEWFSSAFELIDYARGIGIDDCVWDAAGLIREVALASPHFAPGLKATA